MGKDNVKPVLVRLTPKALKGLQAIAEPFRDNKTTAINVLLEKEADKAERRKGK